jgi:MarR family transcriptional regulator, organic hydroperoxide resistance regulator
MPRAANSSPRSTGLQAEMRQSRPFKTLNQEATVALLRTASLVTRAFARIVEPFGLSFAQYNALRIIRGKGSNGIPTLAIRERMIDEGTTITRLLDKLEAAGLIARERSFPDRRQVICYATDAGRELLDRLDPKVDALDEKIVGFLPAGRIKELIRILEEVRRENADRGAARNAQIRVGD